MKGNLKESNTNKVELSSEQQTNLRISTFNCASCYRGGERYAEIFKEGACVGCGAPAGVVIEVSRPQDKEIIKKSILLVYSEPDTDVAKQILQEMVEKGLNIIDMQTVSDSEQVKNRINVLSYLVQNARLTLVIPSKAVSTDALVATAVETGLIGGSRIAPLFPDKSYFNNSSFLETRRGVIWQEESYDKNASKSDFFGFFPSE